MIEIPEIVKKFAEEQEVPIVEFLFTRPKENDEVYRAKSDPPPLPGAVVGLPIYLVFDGARVRYATPDERFEIMGCLPEEDEDEEE